MVHIIGPNLDHGGYAYHFVNPPPSGSDLLCKICQLPSHNPHLSSCCGHTFCKFCIDKLKQMTVFNNICPLCRAAELQVTQNKQIDRAVRSLIIYCKNEGCIWQGEINDIVMHLNRCEFENVRCEYYDMGCKTEFTRKYIKDHNREKVEEHLHMVNCELARTKTDLLQAQEDAITLEKKLFILQKKFQEHSLTTEKKLVDLQNKFESSRAQGQENIKRPEMQFYNSMCQPCSPWTLKLNESSTKSGEQVVPVVLKIKFFSKMKREKAWWQSEYFYSHNKQCKMRLSVYADNNTQHLSIQLSFVYDDSESPLKGNINLLNQIDDHKHHCVIADFCDNNCTVTKNENMNFSEWRDPMFISHNDLTTTSSTSNFIKNDCLFFEVDVKMHKVELPPPLPDNKDDCVTNFLQSLPKVRCIMLLHVLSMCQ